MNDWKQVKLAEVADIKLSNVDKKTKLNQRAIKLCNYTDVYKQSFINSEKSEDFMISTCSDLEYEKFRLKKGQVAITKDSEKRDDIGISTYIAEDFEDVVLGYHLSLITPDAEKLSGKFLNYWFNSKQAKQYFENNAGGSGQRCTLPIDIIKSIPLQIPSLKIQEEIAEVLFSLDKKMELNNKINFELEQMAKTLYDYWFVQFDFPFDFAPFDSAQVPITFDSAQGKRNENGTVAERSRGYKSSGGEMVYNAVLKREIPKGWEVKTVGNYCKSTGGFAFKSNWWTEEGDAVIKIKDIKENYSIDLSDLSRVDLTDKKIDKKFRVKPGDVLIAMTGATVGKYAIVPFTERPLYVNQRVGYFDLGEKPTMKLPFLINSLNQKYFRETVFILASGAAQPNISNDQINNIPLLMPNLNLINLFNEKLSGVYDKILNNQLQNQELASLRDWLLPMLMNGQVRVGESDREGLGLVAEERGEYKKK